MKSSSMKRYGMAALLAMAVVGAYPVYAQINSNKALSEQETRGLLRMVEEEKLAGDVYQTLYEKTGVHNFGNIVRSERQHQNAVRNLLQNYGIADPSAGKKVGEFSDPEFTKLYQQLVAQGSRSTVDALKVGTLIEELDIADLNTLTRQTQRTDMLRVYENLNRGSRNHLRSFDSTLKRQFGASAYQPQHLTQAQYNAIISSAHERGGMAGGMGGGRGMNGGSGAGAGMGSGMGRRW